MKIFNKGSNRSTPSCSYCRQEDHRIADCPHAERDWQSLKQGTIPLTSPTPVSWYKNPCYWSDWYSKAEKAVSKIKAARNRANKKRTASTTPRKCGFCGDTGHTRRTCGHMASFITKCERANANWKRVAYDYLVNERGIYVGSAIKAKLYSYRTNENAPQIGLITSVNYDKLNVMTAFGARYDKKDYVQPLEIRAIIDGKTSRVNLGAEDIEIISRHATPRIWSEFTYVSKMTSTAAPLDESWATDNNGEWTWLTKNKSYSWLQEAGIVAHIEDWASKTQ
jgi:hypothetical protein